MQSHKLSFYQANETFEYPLKSKFLNYFRKLSEKFDYPACPSLVFLDSSLSENESLIKIITTLGFFGGWVGFLGYELHEETLEQPYYIQKTEKWKSNEKMIDALWFLSDQTIIFDHLEKKMLILCLTSDEKETININQGMDVRLKSSELGKAWVMETMEKLQDLFFRQKDESFQFMLNFINEIFQKTNEDKKLFTKEIRKFMRDSYDTYLGKIDKCQEIIKSGESYELCLTTKLKFPQKHNDFDIFGKRLPASFLYYISLRNNNPAPFGFYFHISTLELSICSSSPEEFLRINSANNVDFILKMKPIKGTCARDLIDKVKDEELKFGLLNSEKEKSENLMAIKLLKLYSY